MDWKTEMVKFAASHGALYATTQCLAELPKSIKEQIKAQVGWDVDTLIDQNLELFEDHKKLYIKTCRENTERANGNA